MFFQYMEVDVSFIVKGFRSKGDVEAIEHSYDDAEAAFDGMSRMDRYGYYDVVVIGPDGVEWGVSRLIESFSDKA